MDLYETHTEDMIIKAEKKQRQRSIILAYARRSLMKRATLLLAAMLAVLLLAGGVALAAPKTVDPNTLTPPPQNAECKETGQYVICHGVFDDAFVEPEFTLSCGTVYLTGSVHAEGIRWYSDGLLIKRFVKQHEEGTLSLSPTGAQPTVRVFSHFNWQDYYAIPGDEDSAITTLHGNWFKFQLPGSGALLHVAGIDLPDETHHGVERALITDDEGNVVDPEVDAALCEALQP